MTRIAVFISGRGSNLKAIQENIENGFIKGAEIALVFSNVSGARGLVYAENKGLPALCLPQEKGQDRKSYDRAAIEALKPYNIDLICLAGYMRIVSEELIKAYKGRIMNIHPSLLPSFPGLRAQKQALEYGVKITGCTVHFVDEGLDSGPVILQRAVSVEENDTEETLSERILKEEHRAYPEAVRLFAERKIFIDGRIVRLEKK